MSDSRSVTSAGGAGASIAATPSYSSASFGRLQIFHPISLLVLVASFAITSFVVDPNLKTVSQRHSTYFNPNDLWLMGYWAVLFILQVGTALSIAIAATEHTKALLANGISMSLPIANLMLAIWAPLFIVDKIPAFIAGEVMLGIATVLLTISVMVTGVKQAYGPTWRRPVEWAMIHLPARMFLAVLLHVDIWQQGLICFGLAPDAPHTITKTIWPTFIIVVSVGLATALWTFATTDLAFGAAGIYLQLAILFNNKKIKFHNRPAEVVAAHILAIVLLSVAIVAALAWRRVTSRTEGRIALPVSPHEEAALAQAELEAQAAERRARSRREEASRLRDGSDATPSQLERGEGAETAPTRKLGSAQ